MQDLCYTDDPYVSIMNLVNQSIVSSVLLFYYLPSIAPSVVSLCHLPSVAPSVLSLCYLIAPIVLLRCDSSAIAPSDMPFCYHQLLLWFCHFVTCHQRCSVVLSLCYLPSVVPSVLSLYYLPSVDSSDSSPASGTFDVTVVSASVIAFSHHVPKKPSLQLHMKLPWWFVQFPPL